MSAPVRRLGPATTLALLPRILSDPIDTVTSLRERGDLLSLRLPGREILIVHDPNVVLELLVEKGRLFARGAGSNRSRLILGEGLVTLDNERQPAERRRLAPAFHQQAVGAYATTIVDCAERAFAGLEGTVDAVALAQSLTVDVLAHTLFAGVPRPTLARVLGALAGVLSHSDARLALLAHRLDLERLPLPFARRGRESRLELANGVDELLAAAPDEGLVGLLRSASEPRGAVLNLLSAAFETTAVSLAWTWRLLAEEPEHQERLAAEADDVAEGSSARPLADGVVRESLRLYPSIWVLTRRAEQQVELGGETLAPGTLVVVSPYSIHRDPRFHAEPDAFRPQRFSREPRRGSYLPFGTGARMCVGARLATLEETLATSVLARCLRMRPVGPRPRPLPRVSLQVRGQMPLALRPR